MPGTLHFLRRTAVGMGVTCAVVLFYFALVGVFGLMLAVLSLIFGVAFAVTIVIATNRRREALKRS